MSFKNVISSIIPSVGGLIGGKFGENIGSELSNIFFGRDNATEKDIENAILNATPEQIIQLKKMEMDYKVELGKISLQEHTNIAQDIKNARDSSVTSKTYMNALLGSFITIGFFCITILMMFHEMPKEDTNIICGLVGSISTVFIQVATYYFGSSYGSQVKTLIMSQKQKDSKVDN
jgi:hypothetical protein